MQTNLLVISLCIYVSLQQTLQLSDSEDFHGLKTGLSVETVSNGEEASVTLNLISISRKPFRVSAVSSISIPSGAVTATLSNLANSEFQDSWEQTYSVQFNTLSNCNAEDDNLYLILTDDQGSTKFQTVNFTLAPTCPQSAVSLPLTSSIQTYSDSVFTYPSISFNLGDTVYCRTEISTPGSVSSVQIISATLTLAQNTQDLSSPEFFLQEYDSESVSLVSFVLTGDQLTDITDGITATLAITYALTYSSNLQRRMLTSGEVVESKATKQFQIFLSQKCDEIGEIVTEKCDRGGEIVKICQANGFHIVKDSCHGEDRSSTDPGFSQVYLAASAFLMVASVAVGMKSLSNTKTKHQ